MIAVGDKVKLQSGVSVRVRNDEDTDEDQAARPWLYYEVGEVAGLEDVVFDVICKTGPHATMTGGGWDWTLRDGKYGDDHYVRTTFRNDERATFVVVARKNDGPQGLKDMFRGL